MGAEPAYLAFGPYRQGVLSRLNPEKPLRAETQKKPVKPASKPAKRAIEDQFFPFEHLSEIAELESWRKEVNRPAYHMHKWWAQRLGSVFRAIVLGALEPASTDVLRQFYAKRPVSDQVVFDPFMGSGTTVGEAVKLGARAIGRDINPVSHFAARISMSPHSRQAVLDEFAAIERDTAPILKRYYHTDTDKGGAEVLYYFWVKQVACPLCAHDVDLFSRYVFSQHAYPKKHPEAKALCPHCGAINTVAHDAPSATCNECHLGYLPQEGPASHQRAQCRCGHDFAIARTVAAQGTPPKHRMYAKMVLLPDGTKTYMRATSEDMALYACAEAELAKRPDAYPIVRILPGYNTNQALNYNYDHWHLMFNARQLLCLSILAARIGSIENREVRELFTCLFSGCLEFNNMFASFKGEGTGAVRHMFSHHILKPERTPLEANPWGTPKSSGSFSTLFKSRILRALDYQERPFELRASGNADGAAAEKVYDISHTLTVPPAESYAEFAESGSRVYLSCGDSSDTDLPAGSVDAVITDPPFFDNVHYSQLADFFFVWQRHMLGATGPRLSATTRRPEEVQNSDEDAFTNRLEAVWRESRRVLKDDGLLVFSYHHSRSEGWRSVWKALDSAGFLVVAAHPVKSEMSVAMPKTQAKEPIDYDIIFVCRKRPGLNELLPIPFARLLNTAKQAAMSQVHRLRQAGRRVNQGDVRVILMAQVVLELSSSPVTSVDPFTEHQPEINAALADFGTWA